jgi:methylenetetrahydrofolate dehydrogenase (NADP+) / methenyltetrahydrofolate cyclohydrolase
MTATLIDGRAIAARVRAEVAEETAAFTEQHGRAPGLATVLVGDDPASAVYVAGKQRASAEIGMVPVDKRLPADASTEQVEAEVQALNEDPAVNGILVQLPVPGHLDGRALTELVLPEKDVDGLTTYNAGMLALGTPQLVGATPLGVMVLLEEAGVDLNGAEAVVVGRSNLFGKPMAQLLLGANATVTVCHSRTRDLAAVCRRADVLVAAIGRPRMLGAEAVKPGAAVIDVGMNRISPEEAHNKSGLVGDVDYAAVQEIASAITPVPGGVGQMTVAMLLRNTLQAARIQVERDRSGSLA